MNHVSPLFSYTTEPRSVRRRVLRGFFVGILAGVVDGCWLDALIKCILRINYLFFATLLGKGGVVVMSMRMLVCRIQLWICRDFRFLIHD